MGAAWVPCVCALAACSALGGLRVAAGGCISGWQVGRSFPYGVVLFCSWFVGLAGCPSCGALNLVALGGAWICATTVFFSDLSLCFCLSASRLQALTRPPIGTMRLVDCSRPLIVKVLRSDGKDVTLMGLFD